MKISCNNFLGQFSKKQNPQLKLLILIFSLVFFGILSVYFGQDANTDLRNYHYYNPYAFLKGRLEYDYAPAQPLTYQNPFLDLPFYFLVTYLPPKWVGFSMGALHGCNFWLLYLIGLQVFSTENNIKKIFYSLASASVGTYGAGFFAQIGTTFNDDLVSLFILFPIFLIIRKLRLSGTFMSSSLRFILLYTGLILGLGMGFKYTLAPFAFGIIMSLPLFFSGLKARLESAIICGSGIFAGFVLSAGYWMYKLWDKFHNPFFPFYNKIFKSPYYGYTNIDSGFFPKDWFQTLFYPFYFTYTQHTVMELDFRDIRFAMVYVLIVFFLLKISNGVFFKYSKPTVEDVNKEGCLSNYKLTLFFTFFFVITYIIWQQVFSTYRYIIPLEILSPIFIILLLSFLLKDSLKRAASIAILFVAIVLTVKSPDWGHISWSDSFFGVEVPATIPDNSIIILVDSPPAAYVIPAFPPKIRFVRIDARFVNPAENLFIKEVERLFENYRGPVYLLYNLGDLTSVNWRLVIDPFNNKHLNHFCKPVKSRLDKTLLLCRIA